MKKVICSSLVMVLVLLLTTSFSEYSSQATPAQTTELFFSEYIEGSSYNKALEFYNDTGTTINLTAGQYDVQVYFNGSASPGLTLVLSGTVSSGDVFVLAHSMANQAILDQADQLTSASLYNGDDAVVLRKNGVIIDAIGQTGFDPGNEWGTGDTSTMDNTIRRKSAICQGDPIANDPFDPSIEWVGYPLDNFDGLGSHTADCDSPPPAILINEVDADQTSTDTAEFLELYDGGVGNTALDNLVVVFFNGSGDTSYKAIDLDGYKTDESGNFVICANAATVANCDLDSSPDTDFIQNGADAIALYSGNAADFPNGSPVTIDNLIDALVYDTDDDDDPELLALLNLGQPQINENGTGNKDLHSNQRKPNGTGGTRNTDTYTQCIPTPGAENCPEVDPGVCGAPATYIHEIQGSGLSSPLQASMQVVEGVVVGDFQDTATQLRGFFLQEDDFDIDADSATAEGIFVFDNGFGVDVGVGQVVRVLGEVTEFYGLTELSGITYMEICGNGTASVSVVTLPVNDLVDWEAYEGMLVQINQPLYVTDNYNLGQYGEVGLSVNGRLDAPTNLVEPGDPALVLQDLNDRSRIQLDDGSAVQNPLPLPPYLGPDKTLRAGDSIPGLTGILSYSYGAYEIHPTQTITFTRNNYREAYPEPSFIIWTKVASMNLLNFFTTIDNGLPICGPSGGMECRGADSVEEFNRQRAKLLSTLSAINADIYGLIEVENNATTTISNLVDGLNDLMEAGTYTYIDTGIIGTDAVKVALIYKPAAVIPVGPFAILDASVDPTFLDTYNRPSLIQTFESVYGERFTVAVNHFKSKGSDCDDVGDPDVGDGQSNCNLTRTAAANALVNWLATDPTGSGDPDFLIIGDLNSYAMEDPIDAIKAAGYIDLINVYSGTGAYSYVYQGQKGYLDHALANSSLSAKVIRVYERHTNADEPTALDYNDYNQPELYAPNEWRASDHDPVIVYIWSGDWYMQYLPVMRR